MIRKAILEDMEALIKLGRKAHQTSPTYRDVPMDETKCRMLVINSLADKDSVILVAERKGAVDARMQELRWLLEELRVSFFAQELRTPQPVSLKRLDKLWAQVNS